MKSKRVFVMLLVSVIVLGSWMLLFYRLLSVPSLGGWIALGLFFLLMAILLLCSAARSDQLFEIERNRHVR
jgi:hypothetical protein